MNPDDLELYRRASLLIWSEAGEHCATPLDLRGAEAELVLALLQRNQVPLLSLNPYVGRIFLSEDRVMNAVGTDRALWRRLRDEYVRAHQTLQGAGIRGVFIKSVGLEPSFPYKSSNLDLLVPREQGRRARELLCEIGYVELTNLDERGVKLLLRKFHLGKEVCSIHLHMHVGWWVSFLDEQELISRAGPSPDDEIVWMPSPEDGALINMAHSIYENKAISLSDLQKVEYCLLRKGKITEAQARPEPAQSLAGEPIVRAASGSEQLDWEYVCDVAERKGWLDGLYFSLLIYDHLESRLRSRSLVPSSLQAVALSALTDWQRRYLASLISRPLCFPFPIGFRFSKRLFYRKIWGDRSGSALRKLSDAASHTARGTHLRLGVRSQTPMLVTLSGIDGSGKTSHAEALCDAFRSCAIRVRYVWSRASSSSFTDRFIGWGKRILQHETGAETASAGRAEGTLQRRKGMLRSPLARWGWPWVVVLDLLIRYWLRVGWPLLRGDVVIADRYVADALADLAVHLGSKCPERSAPGRLLRFLSPHPDVTYLLDVSAETAARRMAGERESIEHLERLGEIHSHLVGSVKVATVDAEQPLEDVADLIVYRTLTDYFERYGTWVNALFAANPVHPPNGRGRNAG